MAALAGTSAFTAVGATAVLAATSFAGLGKFTATGPPAFLASAAFPGVGAFTATAEPTTITGAVVLHRVEPVQPAGRPLGLRQRGVQRTGLFIATPPIQAMAAFFGIGQFTVTALPALLSSGPILSALVFSHRFGARRRLSSRLGAPSWCPPILGTLVVSGDARIFQVPVDLRSFAVSGDAWTYLVPVDLRTYLVPEDNT